MANVLRHQHRGILRGWRISLALFLCAVVIALVFLPWKTAAADGQQYDRDRALAVSQAAIGETIGDYSLTTVDGTNLNLHDFRGKPLLVSMIFTSCHHICPTTTKHIALAVEAAQEVLGDGSFEVVTIGFDTAIDDPQAMRSFARQQGVSAENWRFLSATPESIAGLTEDLGFQFFPSPRGFDHLNQLSLIDHKGKVYSQVYGVNFELPWLIEPLKQLVLNQPKLGGHRLASLFNRVRLFCTVYNPKTGRYEIDNSLFFQTAIGFIVVLSIGLYLLREIRTSRIQ